MKKILLIISALFATIAGTADIQAQPVIKAKKIGVPTTGVTLNTKSRAAQNTKIMPFNIGNYYEAGETDNFYMMFSDNKDAAYDGTSGTVNAQNCDILYLDVYAVHAADGNLPVGEYAPGVDGGEPGTYSTEYSYVATYDADGNVASYADLKGNLVITKNSDGDYDISVGTDGATYNYVGPVKFRSNDNAFVYDQINADVVVDESFKTGLGNYEGNLFQSKTGNMYINLYNVDIDTETGAMNGPGFNIAISAFNTLFSDPKKATVRPGVYTMARNFKRETFYPGMEVTYMEMTIPFGSYVKQLKPDGNNYYAYITDGTITITQAEDGTYGFVFDCVTADGHTLTGSTSGVTFTINDLSDDKPVAVVSTLEEDHELDLDYVKKCYTYKFDDENGCGVFVAFIGMPSGIDGTEGDLFRMEFLTEPGSDALPVGTYELMEENHLYYNLYAPYKLVQGYFNNDGALIGTRYLHYEEGRNCVMDQLAPIVSGSISVEQPEEGQVKFTIDTYDDAENRIYGTWQGSVSPSNIITGISELQATGRKDICISQVSNNVWLLHGLENNDNVRVYNTGGALVSSSKGAVLNTGNLVPGVYVVKAADMKPIKIVKK